jgi:glutathione synthase/RimK-type ligase-like ATP-grasp enzyme
MCPDPAEILLVSHSGDFYTIDRVAAALRRAGLRARRLDTDLFPTRIRMGMALGRSESQSLLVLPDGTVSDPARIAAVWMRRVFPPHLPEDTDPLLAPGCREESSAALIGFLGQLEHARFIDPPAAVLAAGDKMRQLRCALRHGLRIPATLVSNDPAQVKQFFAACDGRVIAKMLHALSHSMGRAPLSVPTSEVRQEDLAHLDSLSLSPMVFQERIDKGLELRVAYVSGQCFVGGIDASGSRDGRTDWRRAQPQECGWQKAQLPDEEQRKLNKLMQSLGLRFGAVDYIRTPRNDHVFLEVNPAGEWGMLEQSLGLPISDAIARELTQP